MDWDEVVSGRARDHASPAAPAGRSRRRSSGSHPSGSRRAGGSRPTASRGAAASRRGRRRASVGKRIGLGIVFTILGIFIVGAGAFLYLYATLDVPKADQVALAQTSTVYYADGKTEMGAFSEVNRTIIDTTKLPDYVGKAVVASEDRTFYTNSGVDVKGMARALFTNVTTGTRQGGSTLSQQYIERYYEGETTSYKGKVKEAILALKVNREQTKDEILGNYMNTIYFGRGAYGIEAAAKAYFGVSAKDLTLSQSAMLAGIIPAPSAWDPAVDEAQATSRWKRVLGLMVQDGWINQADADKATVPPTLDPAAASSSSMSGSTGYLLQQVRTELRATGAFTDEQIDSGGLRIITTLDKKKQDAAVAAAESMTQVEGWNSQTMHTALTSIDPATGEIVAEYAGGDYQKRQQNAATQDIAAGGSTFKTFALLADARKGGSMAETFDGDSPQTFDGLQAPVGNDGGYSWGTIDLVKATMYSVNTAFVHLNEQVGPANTLKAAVDAGIPEKASGLEPTLLNVLGFAAPHNIDIATAYSTIASGGMRTQAHVVREVQDTSGSTVFTTTVKPERAFEVGDVSEIMPALEAVMGPGGTGEKVAALGRPVAGKTGTSEEQKSAQFVAFVPQLATAVSMYQSDENGNAVALTNIGGLGQFHGGDWPADVWMQYMQVATQGMAKADFTWMTPQTRSPSATPSPTATRSATPSPTPTPTRTRTTAPPVVTQAPTPTPSKTTQEPASPTPTTTTETPTDGGTGTTNP